MSAGFIDENIALLKGRWRYLKVDAKAGAAFGFDHDTVDDLISLEEAEVERAARASTFLFRLGITDQALMKLLGVDTPERSNLHEIDDIITHENEQFLLNRWAAARLSAAHASTAYGLSKLVAERLRNTSLAEVQSAGRKGVRLAAFAGRRQYIWHAGKNPVMSLASRTNLAIVNTTRLGASAL